MFGIEWFGGGGDASLSLAVVSVESYDYLNPISQKYCDRD